MREHVALVMVPVIGRWIRSGSGSRTPTTRLLKRRIQVHHSMEIMRDKRELAKEGVRKAWGVARGLQSAGCKESAAVEVVRSPVGILDILVVEVPTMVAGVSIAVIAAQSCDCCSVHPARMWNIHMKCILEMKSVTYDCGR